MKRNILLIIGLIIATFISSSLFAKSFKNNSKEENTKEIEVLFKELGKIPEYSMFLEALDKTNLKTKLSSLESYTLLIPTNRAFRMLSEDVYENFMDPDYKEELTQMLAFHIIPNKFTKTELRANENLQTLQGEEIDLVSANESIFIENATLLNKKLETKHSNTYSVDRIIMPL